MRKVVLTFGLLSGAIISAMLLLALPFQDALGFDRGAIHGYTSMTLAFLMICFGVRPATANVTSGQRRCGRDVAGGAVRGGNADVA